MINTAYKFYTNHDHEAQSKEKVSRISPWPVAILVPCVLCSRLEHEGRGEIADGVCVCVNGVRGIIATDTPIMACMVCGDSLFMAMHTLGEGQEVMTSEN